MGKGALKPWLAGQRPLLVGEGEMCLTREGGSGAVPSERDAVASKERAFGGCG